MNKQRLTERISKWISPKLNIWLLVLYLMVALCLLVSQYRIADRFADNTVVQDVSDDWFYHVRDGHYNISAFAENHQPKKGEIYQLTTILPDSLSKDYAIAFASRNCKVTVMQDHVLLYQNVSDDSADGASCYGKQIHLVTIPEKEHSKTLDIYFMPLSTADTGFIDSVYAGEETYLLHALIRDALLQFITDMLIILLSIIMLLIGCLNYRRREGTGKFYLGLFSLCFGIFSLTHLEVLTLFFECSGFLYNLQYLTLALLPYPALCYIMHAQEILPTMRHNVIRSLPLLNFLVVVVLHFSGIMTFNRTRLVIHLVLQFFIIVVLYYLIRKQLTQKLWKHPKENMMNVLYFALVICGVTEYVLYHKGILHSFLMCSRIILLLILLIQLLSYAVRAQKLMEIGCNAKHLEDAAFFDSLTGLRNRTSLNQDIEELEQHLTPNSSIALIQLDINYLKRTNDVLGHIAGDRLLKNAAIAIRTGFADFGKCYRMGGDEFIVILEGNPHEKYNLGIAAMENSCEKINKLLSPMEHVSIAYGIAYYNPECDTGLWKVQERADILMYERKRAMKQKKASCQNYRDERL